jgi:hypothetical protein
MRGREEHRNQEEGEQKQLAGHSRRGKETLFNPLYFGKKERKKKNFFAFVLYTQ